MKIARMILIASLLCTGAFAAAPIADAQEISDCAPDGIQESGAVYRICMPALAAWNGDLVVYAHGYVAPDEPIEIPEDQLAPDKGPSIPEIANGLGYAFATTSYSVNGLAVRQGLDDLVDLVSIFTERHGQPGRVYLVGPSEGGVITALALEQHQDRFDGGLSACGPVGDFAAQINYWGDARVLFDYFFPDLLPGTAVSVPEEVVTNWDTIYEPRITAEVRARPFKSWQYMTVANIPINPFSADDNVEAILDLLWYNVFATNDGIEKLGGQPFDNRVRSYSGSVDDYNLNLSVARYGADPAAVAAIQTYYQTTGALENPIVMMHTVDPIIPIWHQSLYALKVKQASDEALQINLPIQWRYGHCNFTPPQLLIGFVMLVKQVTGTSVPDAERVLVTQEQRAEYRELVQTYQQIVPIDGTIYLPFITGDTP